MPPVASLVTTPSAGRRLAAWAVHAFTASGVLWGLLAVLRIARSEDREAFVFMIVAVGVASLDGMLARWARVQEPVPRFDGTLLDNLVDYVNTSSMGERARLGTLLLPATAVLSGRAEYLRAKLAGTMVTIDLGSRSAWLRTLRIGILLLLVPMSGTAPADGQSRPSDGAIFGGSRSGAAVVLPFSNVSGDPADDWLGAGIAETVAVDLRNLFGVVVLERATVAAAGRDIGASASVQRLVDLGRALRAAWVVTGGYQRLGDQVRITARLVDVASGTALRSIKLDGTLGEIFALQDQIVSALDGGGSLRPLDPTGSVGSGEARAGGRVVPRSEGIVVPPPDRSPSTPSGDVRQSPAGLTPADVTGGVTVGRSVTPGIVPGRTSPAGFGSRPEVVPARVAQGPSIDGRLDDDAWRGAVRITNFVQMNPLEGAPASEETEVYLAYDNNNFYVGVYAHYSDVALIRANRVERDQTVRDDKVTLYFDPFLDQQRAYVFSVNGYGVQGDATINSSGSRGGRRRQGGGRGGPGGGPPGVIPQGDTSWDALFSSAGGLAMDGWTAEMAIPFKSLRYPARGPGEAHRWGLQIARNIESKDERAVWAPVSRGISGFITQMGMLDGMTSLSTSRNLELLPTVTGIQAGSLNTGNGDFFDDDFSPEAGLNVKYGITSNLTADFTVNPDFSQIESDQPQIEVNQRFPLFFSELRPFFLEGQEIFNIFAPINYIHTRTIVDPRFGAKLTGKVGRSTLGVLVADDEAPGKRADPADPAFGKAAQVLIGRYRYDLYGESHIGGAVTDREFVDSYNRVVVFDSQLRIGGTDRLNIVAGRSATREEDGSDLLGWELGTAYRHNGRNLTYTVFSNNISPDFRNQSGFVRRVNERRYFGNVAYRWWPETWLINWGPRGNYERSYDFDVVLQDEVVGGGFDFAFARSITAGLGANRALERFGGIDFMKWNYSTSFNVNTSRLVSLEGSFDWGDGIFFSSNPFLGRSTRGRLLSSVRPFSRLQADVSVDFSDLRDPLTDAEVFDVKIFRAFTTFQFTERFLLRNITEYNSFDKTLDANILFTYRVNSGTVLFVGYDDHYQQGDFIDFGETLAERFLVSNRLQRTNRAFFMKFSYLFRY